MATRSSIWIRNEDGTTKGIYCHWDGHPSNNGNILLKYYATEEQVRSLISLGFISSLKENTDFTEAYHRDRGEDLDIYEIEAGEDIPSNYLEEWGYLFKNGKWYVKDGYEFESWTELTQEICDNN